MKPGQCIQSEYTAVYHSLISDLNTVFHFINSNPSKFMDFFPILL